MKNTNKKKVSRWAVAILFVVLVIIFLHFPLIDYKGKKILVFAFEPLEVIVKGGMIYGSVIGNYVLETEYGDI